MIRGDQRRRMVVLTEGQLGVLESKTANSLIRYCPDEVVAVLDSRYAGEDIERILGIGRGIPIVASIAEALSLQPTMLVIGVAPVGGGLDTSWRPHICAAIEAGMDIVAGLHYYLSSDPEISSLAREKGVRLFDVRRPPNDIPVASGRARETRAKRILTVGSDCSSGKMATALEITRAARKRGIDAEFVATGQTGIMISGWGIAIDRVVSDFVAGAAERLALQAGDHEWAVIEGQGSITHPGYSAVTLGLVHGAAPDVMIFCHQPGRTRVRHFERFALPSCAEQIRVYEEMARFVHPSRVVALSLNTFKLSDADAKQVLIEYEKEIGLPATDPIRFGADKLVDAITEESPWTS